MVGMVEEVFLTAIGQPHDNVVIFPLYTLSPCDEMLKIVSSRVL